MHEQDMAIVRALVPVAWADGVFADTEKQMLDALLDAYRASDEEKEILREYAEQKRTLDDIDMQELSADDRRVLFQHAVLLSFADGDQSADEVKLLHALAAKMRIDDTERDALMEVGAHRAKKYLKLL
ncbi:MAG: TerB family tellurite resistance protein [Polyangiaceae bacterium]